MYIYRIPKPAELLYLDSNKSLKLGETALYDVKTTPLSLLEIGNLYSVAKLSSALPWIMPICADKGQLFFGLPLNLTMPIPCPKKSNPVSGKKTTGNPVKLEVLIVLCGTESILILPL